MATTDTKDMTALEEGTAATLDFNRLGRLGQMGQTVVPVALQNADTLELLYVAYVNEQSLLETLKLKQVVLWSTSRNKLWHKGATSGDYLNLVEARVNCEQNSLVYRVRPRRGDICHTKNAAGRPRNCFYRRLDFTTGRLEHLDP